MNPSRLFIERPIATSLLMFAILLAGIVAYRLLPVSSLPEVDYPTIQVSTFYPGAGPDVMATAVTAPLEKQFGQMPGLNQMTSASSNGASIINLQFSLDLSLDVAEQEVQAAINAATTYLPTDLPVPPVYSKINPADAPVLTVALTSKYMPLQQVEDFADTRLAQKISQLSGVGLVSISGGQRPAVRVQVNPDALTAYGLTLESVRTAIAAANVNAAKGNFDGPRLSYTINSNDQLLTSADYRPLIIAYKNNAPLRLSDIADVKDGVENTNLAAWMNTEPAVIMNIQRQPGANVIAVVDRIKQLLPQLRTVLPATINIFVLTDRTVTIRASVLDVELDLMLAVALVVTVIFLFLRNLPATIIPSVAVPLSLIGTFAAMYWFGFSLNNLTLMALTIATGFVVDDAIVMIENISRYLEQGYKPLEAALKGSQQIAFTIISLSLSLIAVLIPLLFMGDIVGRLFREFAITVSVTIVISAFVSLTLTPMLCARMLQHREKREATKFERKSTELQDYVLYRYKVSLGWVLEHQFFMLMIAIVTLLLTAAYLYIIPKGFFPPQDSGVIQGISVAPQSISFPAMQARQQALARVVLQDPAVANVSSFIGVDGVNPTLNTGRMMITLKPLNQRKLNSLGVIQRLQQKLNAVPGATLYMQAVQDLTIDDTVSRTQYQFSLSSPDSNEVNKWTTQLVNRLQHVSALSDVTSDVQNNGLVTHITIDRDTAYRLGLNTQQVDDVLYDAFGQRQVSTVYTQRNQYRVILEAMPHLKKYPNAIDNIYFTSSAGKPIPIDAFTHVQITPGPLVINRLGQFPVATVSFNLAPGVALGNAVSEINTVRDSLGIPLSVETSYQGSAAVFQSSLSNEGWLVLASILVVYIVLGILYESYIHPLTIISTLPSATMGALLALLWTRSALTIIALIGIILLIGIVMKNAIMMIDFALEQERVYGKTPREAIYEAALLRFRPILMTTFASFFSAVPLAFGTGMGSELRQPLGIAIMGGLITSQLLTLYTTPVIYLYFDRAATSFVTWRKTWFNPETSPGEAQ